MSLLNLLSLDDENIDRITGVVREWCECHQVALDSDRGRAAMSETTRLAMTGETNRQVLAEKLASHMRVGQYRHPTE